MANEVDQIKTKLDIVEVVSSYVELHKSGKHYKGLSPFTSEKTPSFMVSPDRGMYYCFSTSQGGDMFTFIQKMEGVEFRESLKMLAEKAGVELVPENPEKRSAREAQFALLDEAALFFQTKLRDVGEAKDYLQNRGMTGKTAAAWRVGYAPDKWRELRKHLASKNYTDAQMQAAGLVKGGGDGKEPYDVFRDRLMFPIMDTSGRVIAFSGRILHPRDEAPKYVNSPETELFKKGEALYGYHLAKEGIRKYDFALAVEGQFDVVLSHQAGWNNTVAVSGTALTPTHVKLMQRLSDRVVLALDADKAGIAACKRSAEIMLAIGMDVKVARMPDGEDPADIIQKDAATFKQIIADSVPVVEYLLGVYKKTAKDDRAYKLTVREEVLPVLVQIENRIDREHFENVVAEAIGTTKDAIHFEVERLVENAEKQKAAAPAVRSPEVSVEAPVPVAAEPERGSERLAGLLAYFEALKTLTSEKPGADAVTFADRYDSIIASSTIDTAAASDPEVVSKLLFTLESYIGEVTPKVLADEVGTKLTELETMLVKQKLQTVRAELQNSEITDEAQTSALEQLQTLNLALQAITKEQNTFQHLCSESN